MKLSNLQQKQHHMDLSIMFHLLNYYLNTPTM